jgi:hypothetical protein
MDGVGQLGVVNESHNCLSALGHLECLDHACQHDIACVGELQVLTGPGNRPS